MIAPVARADEDYKELGRTKNWHIWTSHLDSGDAFCSLSADLADGRSFDIGKFYNSAAISLRVIRTGWKIQPGGDVTIRQTYSDGAVWRLAMTVHDDALIGDIQSADVMRYLKSIQDHRQTVIAFAVEDKPARLSEQPWIIDIDDGAGAVASFLSCIETVMMPAMTGPAMSGDQVLPPARIPAPAFQPFGHR